MTGAPGCGDPPSLGPPHACGSALRRLALGVLLLLAAAGSLRAGSTAEDARFDALARTGIEQVYNLQFEEAQKTFADLAAMRPHHPAGPFFTAMITWWRILIDIDNTRYDDEFYAELDRVTDMCDSLLEQNPNDVTAIFFKGGAIGFKGRLKFHRNDYLAAANAGRKALPLVQTAAELDPNNYDIELGTGMYNYYAEVVPSEYPWLKPLLLFVPPGDRQKGLQQIATAAEKGKYASIEATYFLMQIYFYYEKDFGKALALCRELFTRFPHNMLFHRYLGRSQMALADWNGGRATFTEILRRVDQGWRGYTKNVEREAVYYLGLCSMNLREYDTALQYLYRCDELSRALDLQEPSGFMVMTNLKIGNIYDIQGKRALALEQYQKVLAMKEFKDSHKQAEQFLKSPATY